jgi:hypothetical protein
MSTIANPNISETVKQDFDPHWFEKSNSQALGDLNRSTIQATGRDKAMNLEAQDKVGFVIDKLETLKDLFEFYCYALNKTDFTKDSLSGLCLIISGCIAELKDAVK